MDKKWILIISNVLIVVALSGCAQETGTGSGSKELRRCVSFTKSETELKSRTGIKKEIRRAQISANNSNGKGIVGACPNNVSTGFGWGYPDELHTGSTIWYIFAERKLNPYWGTSTGDPIRSHLAQETDQS